MKGGSIRIGIDAPRDKKIYRQEVFDRIAAENRDAANWNMTDLESLTDNLTTNKRK
jgi:carbon storage regulator